MMDRLTEFHNGIWGMSVKAVEDGYDRYSVFSKLAEYENLNLTPQQLTEIDKLYLEKCEEVNRLKTRVEYYKGCCEAYKLGIIKQDNWIPVSEWMPECEKEVFIQTKRGIITSAMYENGKMTDEGSEWHWNEIEYVYDEETDTNYIPEGWWEYKHFAPDDVYNYQVDDEVIAWQPMPEPYKQKREIKILTCGGYRESIMKKFMERK